MALLILVAALWIAVLSPGVYKRLTQRRSVESIEHFHHQLHLLGRTGPKIVAPAYRLETAEPNRTLAQNGGTLALTTPNTPNLVLLTSPSRSDGLSSNTMSATSNTMSATSPDSGLHVARYHAPIGKDSARQQTLRNRRRNAVGILIGTLVFTGLLGTVRELRPIWIVTAITAALLLGYLGLAAYAKQLVMAREHRAEMARQAHRQRGVMEADLAAARRRRPREPGQPIEFPRSALAEDGPHEDYEVRQAVAAR